MGIYSANPAISHTYGNLACVAMEYIKKYFPEDFFSTTHISTKLAYRQLDIFKSSKELFKRSKPMLILRPRIELNDSSVYLYGSALTSRQFNTFSRMEMASASDIIKDEDGGVRLRYLTNRVKITFDVVIILETFNQQINIATMLQNKMVPLRPWMIHTPLEAHVPKSMVYEAANHMKIDPSNTADVLMYLNTHSDIPFTYKLKNSSGDNEFFCLFDSNVECIISELNLDDGSKKDMIYDTYTISFAMSLESYAMSGYYLFTRDGDKTCKECALDEFSMTSGEISPLYTIPLLHNMELDEGWAILTAPNYMVDSGCEFDETDISSVFPSGLDRAIMHHLYMNVPLDTLVQFKVYKGTQELTEGDGFKIDLEGKKLITYDLNTNLTYRLFVIVNNALVNSISSEIIGFDKEK